MNAALRYLAMFIDYTWAGVLSATLGWLRLARTV